MKLHEQRQAHMNLVGHYGDGGVTINGQCLQAPLMVAPGFLHADWIPDIANLTAASLAPVWHLEPRLLLLGSSSFDAVQLKSLRQALIPRQVALEVMDLGAACRTYNVLAQEERAVAALLFPT